MAVTKIWRIKDSVARVVDYAMNPEKTKEASVLRHDLSQVLDYAGNPDKTDHFCYVTGINCIPEAAAEQMEITKRRYGKTGGNVAFHAYQSFKPGEVTPDQCHAIGTELAQKLWGERFEVIVATHLNTGCLHNHFVLNSVSFRDGKRYNDCKATYRAFRALSDELCRERGLSVVECPEGGRTPRNLYLAEKEERTTRYSLMRQDIDEAISRSYTDKFFYQELRRMGYIVQWSDRRKYAALQIPGTKHPTRFRTLGTAYSEKAIRERILQNRTPSIYLRPPKRWEPFLMQKSSIRGLYLHYCYLLGMIREEPHPHYSAAVRADIQKLEEYDQQTRLLCREGIDTMEDLQTFLINTQTQLQSCIKEREKLYKRISRCTNREDLPELVKKRDELTDLIRQIRKDSGAGQKIMERSEEVAEKVKLMEEWNQKREKEVNLCR